jgi:hypothetical protein
VSHIFGGFRATMKQARALWWRVVWYSVPEYEATGYMIPKSDNRTDERSAVEETFARSRSS